MSTTILLSLFCENFVAFVNVQHFRVLYVKFNFDCFEVRPVHSGRSAKMMDDGVIIVLDYEKICRLCLQTKGALSDIFDKDDEVPLSLQIKLITSVEIIDSDMLPKKICHKCRYIVELCFDLRGTVQKSNKLLCDSKDMDMEKITQVLERGIDPSNDSDFYQDEDINLAFMEENDDNSQLKNILASDGDMFCTKQKKNELGSENEERRFSSFSLPSVKTEEADGGMESGEAYINYISGKIEEFGVKIEESMKSEEEYSAAEDGRLVRRQRDADDAVDWMPNNLLGSVEDNGEISSKDQQANNITNLGDRPPKHLTCQLCLATAEDRMELANHVLLHYQETDLIPYTKACKPFLCTECDQTFNFKKDLIIHHRLHLNINPYTCLVTGCAYDVRSKDALRHHMYSHGEKKFVCEECGAAFRRKFELGQHRVRHLDEGSQYRCSMCRVVCKNRLSFKAHLKHHETGRRFKCNRLGCPKAFFSNTDLMIHGRAHSNDKCFKCPLCICAYISQSQLNRHLRQHEKRRINKCDKCSESFSDYAEFCNHRISTHGEWHPHKCRGCNQGYQSERQLERHVSRCKLAQKLEFLAVTEESEGAELLQNEEQTDDQPEDFSHLDGTVDISNINCTDVAMLDVVSDSADQTVVIEASQLQHLTDSETVVCGENYLYIEAQDDNQQADDDNDESCSAQYMIIENGDSVNSEQYTYKLI